MDSRDEATEGESRGLAASQSDATVGESATGRMIIAEDDAQLVARAVYDYLGTVNAALVRAWFDHVHRFARANKGVVGVIDGPITWESVS